MKSAFTLIELMVVMTIGALIATVTIPSYIRFNRSQEVKQVALMVKSNLRDTQNRSEVGEKDDIICTTSDTLSGFYGEFSLNSSTFNVRGICGLNLYPSSSSQFQKSFITRVTINKFYDASGASCSALTLPSGVSVLFKPLGKGAIFYNGQLSSGTTTILGITKLAIEFKHSSGDLYYVMITGGGEIYDGTTCN